MLKRFIFITLVFTGYCAGRALWRDFDELDRLARHYKEYPRPRAADPFDMRYDVSGCYGRFCEVTGDLAHILHISWPWWSASAFKRTLARVHHQHLKSGPLSKISTARFQYIITWGGLYGSFHSLVRCLNQLKTDRLIDHTFKMRKGCVFIFLGNSIDRSAYGLETLAVIVQLMDKNPGQVVLLRGKHEDRGYWRNFGTSDQVRVRLGDYRQTAQLMDTFFSILSTHVVIPYTDGCKRYRKILLSSRSAADMDWPIDAQVTTQVTSDLPSLVYRQTDGLRLLPPERGATTWSLLSCPSQAVQIIHRFFNDSFAIIEPSKTDHWRLMHFYRDVRDQLRSHFQTRAYDLFTGQALSQGQRVPFSLPRQPISFGMDQCDEIVIGSLYDADGLAWDIGNLLRLGLSLRIMKENIEHGGVNGKFLRLVMLNDANNPFVSPQRVKQLATVFKTDLLLAPFGTVTMQANVATIKQKHMFALFPIDGDTLLRTAANDFVLYLRPTYADEGRALAEYAAKTFGFNRALIFFQDHPYGLAVRDGVYEGLKKNTQLADETITRTSYARSTLQLPNETIGSIKQFAPDVIFFGSTRAMIQELVRKLTSGFFVRTKLLAEGMATAASRQFLKERGLSLIMSNVVPSPIDPDIEIARQYRESAKTYMDEEPLDPLTFEAYIAADLFVDALKHIKGAINTRTLADYFQHLPTETYKGLSLSFDANTRQLSHTVWIDNETAAWPKITV